MMNKKKKLILNITASSLYEIVAFVCTLFFSLFIIGAYGSDSNGLLQSIRQFLSYISILTLGIAGPTRVALYKSLTKNDIVETSKIVNTNRKHYIKITYIFVFYMFVLALLFPYIVESKFKWYEIGILVVLIGLGTLAEYSFGTTYNTLLAADQAAYIYLFIRTAGKIANTIVGIILIVNGFSIFILEAESALFYCIMPITLKYIVTRKYKLIKDAKPDSSIIIQRKDAAASSIANIIHGKVDIVVLTLFANTITVSIYSVYSFVTSGLTSLMGVFTSSLEAPFGHLWARNQIIQLKQHLSVYEQFIYSFVTVVFSTAGVLIVPFITMYTKGITDANYVIPSFAVLTIISTAVYCIRQPYLTIVQAAGKYKETKVGNYIEAGINIALSIILVFRFGIIGVTIGTLVANLFRTIQYSLFTSKELIHRSFFVVIKRFIWLLGNVGIISLAFLCIPGFIIVDSWIQFIFCGIKCILFSGIITVISSALFYRKDFSNLITILLMKRTGKVK